MTATKTIVLTIAGSDSGGGAGIQADLKTFAAHGCYGMSVITALTAQNTLGVHSVMEAGEGIVEEQLEAVLSDMGCDAAKTGMPANEGLIGTVSRLLEKYGVGNLVVDPVMVSKNGHRLLRESAAEALREKLLPLAALATPNLEEVGVLLGRVPATLEEMEEAAKAVGRMGPRAVLVKGGHLGKNEAATDVHWDGAKIYRFTAERLNGRHTHGTGCTLSAAIASNLGRGLDVIEAVQAGKDYLTEALRRAYPVGKGIGPVNHLWDLEKN